MGTHRIIYWYIVMLLMLCGALSLEHLGVSGCYISGWLMCCLDGKNGLGSTHRIFRTLSLYVWCGHCGGNEADTLLKLQKAQWKLKPVMIRTLFEWSMCLTDSNFLFRFQRITLLLCIIFLKKSFWLLCVHCCAHEIVYSLNKIHYLKKLK